MYVDSHAIHSYLYNPFSDISEENVNLFDVFASLPRSLLLAVAKLLALYLS